MPDPEIHETPGAWDDFIFVSHVSDSGETSPIGSMFPIELTEESAVGCGANPGDIVVVRSSMEVKNKGLYLICCGYTEELVPIMEIAQITRKGNTALIQSVDPNIPHREIPVNNIQVFGSVGMVIRRTMQE